MPDPAFYEKRKRTPAEQVAGLGLFAYPAPSSPVETSENAADKLTAERLETLRLATLRFVASCRERGATSADVVDHFGGLVVLNTYGPRCSELHRDGFLIRLDGKEGREKRKRPTGRGGEAFVYLVSEKGRALLARIDGTHA